MKTYKEMIEAHKVTFPTMTTDGTKQTIYDWFQDHEVTNEEKFNIYFNRVLNRDLPQFYQLLRLEPGFEESGVAQYDWFVEDYEEVERQHNGFNTAAGNHDLAQVIRKSIGSVTTTEGADTDTTGRTSTRQESKASSDNRNTSENVEYQGGQSVTENNNNSSSIDYKGGRSVAEAENGSDNLQYKGGRVTAEGVNETENTDYNGSKTVTEAESGNEKTDYNGGTNEHETNSASDVLSYNGSEKNDRQRTPNLVHAESGSEDNRSGSVTRNANKNAPQSISYAGGTAGGSGRGSNANGIKGSLQDLDWQYMTAQAQQDADTKENNSNTTASVDSGNEHTVDEKTFNNRNDARGTSGQSEKSTEYNNRNDNHNTQNAKVTQENYNGRDDERKLSSARGTSEQYSGREDDRNTSGSKATVENYNDRRDENRSAENNVRVENYNDRKDIKGSNEQGVSAEAETENGTEAEVARHEKGTKITVTPTGDSDNTNGTNTDVSANIDNGTDHEQRTGRHGYPADILQHAYAFIENSSAWIWLSDRLEICFMQTF